MIEDIKKLLGEVLSIEDRAATFDRSTELFGSLPELDSMAVATVILDLEERFGIEIDGDEIDAETFGTVGSLCDFVVSKVQGASPG